MKWRELVLGSVALLRGTTMARLRDLVGDELVLESIS